MFYNALQVKSPPPITEAFTSLAAVSDDADLKRKWAARLRLKFDFMSIHSTKRSISFFG